MKYILITFYLLFFITISSQDYIEYREVGEQVWLSADNVNLRSTPKDGKILENLPIQRSLIPWRMQSFRGRPIARY